jgi:hypothetical protein
MPKNLSAPDNSDDVHRDLYKRLLDISYPPLAPEVRSALMKVLGQSPRRQKAALAEPIAVTLQFMIEEVKARMEKDGERPRGGRHEAALTEVARTQGITVGALKKRLQRRRPRRKK